MAIHMILGDDGKRVRALVMVAICMMSDRFS